MNRQSLINAQSFNSTAALSNAMARLHSRDSMEDDGQQQLQPQQVAAASSSPSHPQQQQLQPQQVAAASSSPSHPQQQQQQHAAASSSPQISSKRDQSIDDDEQEQEMDKLRPILNRIRQIKKLIMELPILTMDSIPSVSNAIDKSRIPLNCTTKGYADKKRVLAVKVGVMNAEIDRLESSLQEYSTKINDACEAKYSLRAYRAELRAVEATRNDIIAERTDAAALALQEKKERVKGFEERFEKKESNKRKKLGTDDSKKRSIFDL